MRNKLFPTLLLLLASPAMAEEYSANWVPGTGVQVGSGGIQLNVSLDAEDSITFTVEGDDGRNTVWTTGNFTFGTTFWGIGTANTVEPGQGFNAYNGSNAKQYAVVELRARAVGSGGANGVPVDMHAEVIGTDPGLNAYAICAGPFGGPHAWDAVATPCGNVVPFGGTTVVGTMIADGTQEFFDLAWEYDNTSITPLGNTVEFTFFNP